MSVHLTPGLHMIDAEAYHADPCELPSLSASLAKIIFAKSPLHAWTESRRLNPDWQPRDSKTFDIGRAAHRAVLGRGGDYVAYPAEMLASNGAASTKEAKAWAEDQRAAGRVPLKADEVDQIGDMADAVQRHLSAMGIVLDPNRSEMTAIAEIDGVMCRAMVDNAPDYPIMIPGVGARKVIVDFKTIEDATPSACVRAVENYGYDLQRQHYLDVWEAATGEVRDFIFVFCEKAKPHGVSVVLLLNEPGHSGDWSDDAAEKARIARKIWGDCLRSGVWQSYPAQIIQVGANGYFRQKWQDSPKASQFSQSAIDRAAAWQSPGGNQ